MKRIIIIALFLINVSSFALIAEDKNSNIKDKVNYDWRRNDLKINYAKADHIAFSTYDDKIDGQFFATDGIKCSAIKLGYDIPKFAKKGDEIWKATISSPGFWIYCGTLFVHSETGKVHFVSGLWERKDIYATRDWDRKGLRIKNTRSTPERTKQITIKAYLNKMKLKKITNEEFNIEKRRIGWNIPEFANTTDEVWEATITSKNNEFLGIMWIHPVTKSVRYITGPWLEKQ